MKPETKTPCPVCSNARAHAKDCALVAYAHREGGALAKLRDFIDGAIRRCEHDATRVASEREDSVEANVSIAQALQYIKQRVRLDFPGLVPFAEQCPQCRGGGCVTTRTEHGVCSETCGNCDGTGRDRAGCREGML